MSSLLFRTEESVLREYATFSAALREWVHFVGFDRAVKAHDIAALHHTGTRKDKVSPEFSHQQSQALYILSLMQNRILLVDPEGCLAMAFLHDLPEEYGSDFSELSDAVGEDFASCAFRMAKVYRAQKVYPSTKDYYQALSEDPAASIAKCADRIHNLATLTGAFSPEKTRDYILETRTYYPWMISAACQNFPGQRIAYSAMERMISVLCHRLEAHLVKQGNLPCLSDQWVPSPPDQAFSHVPRGVHPLHVMQDRFLYGVPKVKVDKHTLPATLSQPHLKLAS